MYHLAIKHAEKKQTNDNLATGFCRHVL